MDKIDKFSFNRIWLLWEYFRPGIMKHWLICAIATICCYALMQMSVAGHDNLTLYSLSSSALGFVLYFAPLLFTRYNDRRFEIQLPVTVGEKTVFSVGYCTIVIPAVVIIVWYACEGFAALCGLPISNIERIGEESFHELEAMGMTFNRSLMMIMNIAQNTLIILITLYVVIATHRNRTLWAVITPFAAMIALSIISGIYGIYIAIKAAEAVPNGSEAEFTNAMMQAMSPGNNVVIIGISILLLLNIATIYMIYRKFSKIQA